ncbi:SCO family protein [Polyangium aurulentum]|uniref:SCO family protein n=1 Tax=Polyangium aurulentum TaxID=2567896 RepID=UPI0010AE8428|nr:SCO family protein [Polyangium aurulentum]UQA54575.1 SCO family protein [Polyangium aurulentum]
MKRLGSAAILALALAIAPRAAAEPALAPALAPAARRADVDEKLGASIPPRITLTDEQGAIVTTAEVLGGDVPVILVLAYYRCPMLCPLLQDGVSRGLGEAGYRPGRDYRLVTVSIDPKDKPYDASKRRDALMAKLGAPPGDGVRFLVGNAVATGALADAVGFRYAYDPSTDQYAHPAVVTVLAPGGRVSRYLYGLEPPARDLRLSIVEAAQGKIGRIVDRVLLTCYRYDPATRRYGPYIAGFFRIGALLILATVGTGLGLFWRLERRAKKHVGEKPGEARP